MTTSNCSSTVACWSCSSKGRVITLDARMSLMSSRIGLAPVASASTFGGSESSSSCRTSGVCRGVVTPLISIRK